MRKLFLVFLLYLSIALGDEAVYKAYYGFIPIGTVEFKWNDKKIKVEGKVYPYLRFIYDYNFLFEVKDNDFFLYEKENKKIRKYTKEKILEKKPWLPLIVKFLKTKKADEKGKIYPYKLKKEGNTYIIYPLKSKKVKKIVLIFDKDDKFPKKIKIYGKYFIKLERIS